MKRQRPRSCLEALASLRDPARDDGTELGEPWSLFPGLTLLFRDDARGSGEVRVRAEAAGALAEIPSSLYQDAAGRVSLCDFVARRFQAAAAYTATIIRFRSPPNQLVLERSYVHICPLSGSVSVTFFLAPRSAPSEEELLQHLSSVTLASMVCPEHGGALDIAAATAHMKAVEDQQALRSLAVAAGGVAFVANGAVLPRRGGGDDRPLEAASGVTVVPFQSPPSLYHEFELPHAGTVGGMLIPGGITVIAGGGFHGKSTLLRALAVGVYDKTPGDGREFVITDRRAVAIRSEDGRPVSGVDVSPFIGLLPTVSASGTANATTGISNADLSDSRTGDASATDQAHGSVSGSMYLARQANGDPKAAGPTGPSGTTPNPAAAVATATGAPGAAAPAPPPAAESGGVGWFSTGQASGSTSQAANVLEALEAGASALLLDEDTCAGNFMLRDSRMRALVHHETITPFIYRVTGLWQQKGVSSIVVVGGSGDWLDVHDLAVLMDSYGASDVTERGHSISRRYCVGRVQYAGRGLVRRLPWPEGSVADNPRVLDPCSIAAAKAGSCGDSPALATAMGGGAPSAHTLVPVNGREAAAAAAAVSGPEAMPQVCLGGPGVGAQGKVWLSFPRSCGGGSGGYGGGPVVDLSRVEQLLGGAAQARGAGLGVAWVARHAAAAAAAAGGGRGAAEVADAPSGALSATHNGPALPRKCCKAVLTVPELLDALDAALDASMGDGLRELLCSSGGSSDPNAFGEEVARPRRFEVAAALHRIPGARFERQCPLPQVRAASTI